MLAARLLCCALVCVLLPFSGYCEQEKLTVMVYDRGNMPASYGSCTNNEWTAYLQQQALTTLGLEVTYVGLDRGSDLSQLSMLLATEHAPDIMFTYDYALWHRLCESGQLADVSSELAQYGPNILANQASVLPYGQFQGKQYGICNQRASIEVTSGFIRKDWLDQLGISLTQSPAGYYTATAEELFHILCRFRDSGLCGSPGAAPYMIYGTTYWPILLILEAFYVQDQITQEDLFALPYFMFDGAKEGYRFLNRLYNEGLVNQNFAFIGDNDKSSYIDAIVNEQIGFWINDSWFGFGEDETIISLYERNPEAEVVALDILNAAGNSSYKYAYSDYGMILFVPEKSTHKAAAIKYLNLLSDPGIDFTLRYGFEGEHYRMENGLPVAIDEAYNARTRISVKDLALMYNGCPYLNKGIDGILNLQMLPERLRDLRRQSSAVGTSNTFQIPTIPAYTLTNSSITQRLEQLERNLRVQCIMCAPENFDAVWDTCLEAYLQQGGQAQIDSKRSLYRENMP